MTRLGQVFVVNLEKSQQKWYQKHLQAGAHWVTIKKQGPLQGRHVLIDSAGYIVGGKGIPQNVLNQLNGQHVAHHAPVEPLARHDAYQQTYDSTGDREFRDQKGTWTVSEVKHDNKRHGHTLYSGYVKFKPDENAGLKMDSWGKSNQAYFDDETDAESFKSKLKNAIGYTPSKQVVEQMWAHFAALRAARQEEDRHYAQGDKKKAQETLDKLTQKAVDRYKDGKYTLDEEYRTRGYYRGQSHKHHLTQDELHQAGEAQKYINGHSFVNLDDSMHSSAGHLAGLRDRVQAGINEIDAHRKAEEARKKDEHVDKMMENNPAFRKLVAHYAAAEKRGNSKDPETELVHRLYGYTNNYDKWRDNLQNLMDTLEGFGLDRFDTRKLGRMAEKHADNLPAVTPAFERQEGKFYYGDVVHNGRTTMEITKVGQKYLYGRNNVEWEKSKATPFRRKDYLKDPQTTDEHTEQLMRLLHNSGRVVHADHKNIEHVAEQIRRGGDYDLQRFQNDMSRRIKNASSPEQAQAVQNLLDEIRRQQLEYDVIPRAYRKDILENELQGLGNSKLKEVPEYRTEPVEPSNPTASGTPAPAPAKTESKPVKSVKGEGRPLKTGLDGTETMWVADGSERTIRHLKNLKHVHGGAWNGAQSRWEYEHEPGSDEHQKLETYARNAGLRFGMKGAEEVTQPVAIANGNGKTGSAYISGNTFPHRYALGKELGATWDKEKNSWRMDDVPHGGDKHKQAMQLAHSRGLTVAHDHDSAAPATDAPKRQLVLVQGGKPKEPSANRKQEVINEFLAGKKRISDADISEEDRNTILEFNRQRDAERRAKEDPAMQEENLRQNRISGPDLVEEGDRVYSALYRQYGTIAKKYKKSVKFRGDDGHEITTEPHLLSWMSHDDYANAVKEGEPIRPVRQTPQKNGPAHVVPAKAKDDGGPRVPKASNKQMDAARDAVKDMKEQAQRLHLHGYLPDEDLRAFRGQEITFEQQVTRMGQGHEGAKSQVAQILQKMKGYVDKADSIHHGKANKLIADTEKHIKALSKYDNHGVEYSVEDAKKHIDLIRGILGKERLENSDRIDVDRHLGQLQTQHNILKREARLSKSRYE